MKASAVVGAMFGDEGKGRMVDFLSSEHKEKALVVRFNGGAQAGHTVVTPEGKRHVFKHFGSGTFNNSPTYLSEQFIVNPILFREEYNKLEAMGITPVVFVHPDCRVTTPYDMMINQIVEEHRGDARHGSCGVGINETIFRTNYKEELFGLFFADLSDEIHYGINFTVRTLGEIGSQYIPERLSFFDFKDDIGFEWWERFNSPEIITRYMNDVRFFVEHVNRSQFIISNYEHIIFEGAQGLQLDQDSKFFPHVTHSKTGLFNILEQCKKMNIKELDVYYMTRSYTTRHGNGPLPFELSGKPWKTIVDETNIKNDWQGALRFSYLNLDLLKEGIYKDLSLITSSNTSDMEKITASIVVTCMDQIDKDEVYVIKDDQFQMCYPKENFIKTISDILPVSYLGYGPGRNNMERI